MKYFVTGFLVVFVMGMSFTFGTIYQKGQTRMARVPAPVTVKDDCEGLDLCVGRQQTFIQIIDDQSEIINSLGDIIWDLPIEDLKALRKEPKPRKLQKFGDVTKSVEEILKAPATTVPPPVIFPGTNPPVGELY